MPFVRTIDEQFPPRRFDGVVFTKAHIQESPPAGPPNWTTRATTDLDPVYTDALNPPAYNFTTNAATLDPAIYRILWEDASGAQEAGDVWASDSESIGLVADMVKSLMPHTWKALAKADYYGTDLLMKRVKVAKYKAFPAVYAEAAESTYTMLMIDYVAKIAALEIIPAGIEYWMNQKISESATGTNETISYTDRRAALEKLADRLVREVSSIAANPNLVPFLNALGANDVPDVSGNDDGLFITEEPFDFLPAFTTATTSAVGSGA